MRTVTTGTMTTCTEFVIRARLVVCRQVTLVLERLRQHDAPEAAADSASEEEEEEVRRPLWKAASPSGRHSRSGAAPAGASQQQQAAAGREAAQVLLGEGPVDYHDVVSGASMCYLRVLELVL